MSVASAFRIVSLLWPFGFTCLQSRFRLKVLSFKIRMAFPFPTFFGWPRHVMRYLYFCYLTHCNQCYPSSDLTRSVTHRCTLSIMLLQQAAADGVTNPDGSALDMKARMDPWLNQMGYPLVTFSRTGTGTATVSRAHFLSPVNQIMETPGPWKWVYRSDTK